MAVEFAEAHTDMSSDRDAAMPLIRRYAEGARALASKLSIMTLLLTVVVHLLVPQSRRSRLTPRG
jgi:hypothetical protein